MIYQALENLNAHGRSLVASLRQKPSVEAGIVAKETTMGRTYVDYQPGNGTRFSYLFVEIVGMPKLTANAGANPHSWLIMDTNNRRAHLFGAVGFLAPRYVAEKLALSESSSVVIAELISYVTGRTAYTCEEYLREVSAEVKRLTNTSFCEPCSRSKPKQKP